MSNAYEPIVVYELDGKTYIFDGKHRAALCALLGKPVRCLKIDLKDLSEDFLVRVYGKMLEREEMFEPFPDNRTPFRVLYSLFLKFAR
jgi:hypothetical protein